MSLPSPAVGHRKNVILDTYPGQVIWMDNAEHAWELLSGQAHIIAVEVKSVQRTP